MEQAHVPMANQHDGYGGLIEDIVDEGLQLVHGPLDLTGTCHKFDHKVQSLRPNEVGFLSKDKLQVRFEQHFPICLLKIFFELQLRSFLDKLGLGILRKYAVSNFSGNGLDFPVDAPVSLSYLIHIFSRLVKLRRHRVVKELLKELHPRLKCIVLL